MVACFFRKTSHVATVILGQRCTVNYEWYTTIIWRKLINEQEKTNHRPWQCELSHIGSNQRLFDPTKHRIDGSTAAQPCLGIQWRLFISTHQENIVWSMIFAKTPSFVKLVFSSHCKQHKWWSYVKTFWVELCYQNVKLQLAAPEICQAKNLSSKPRIENTEIRQNLFNLPNLSCVNLLFRITAKIKTKVSFITDPSWFQ